MIHSTLSKKMKTIDKNYNPTNDIDDVNDQLDVKLVWLEVLRYKSTMFHNC